MFFFCFSFIPQQQIISQITPTTNEMIEVQIKKEIENEVSISQIEQILPTPVASPLSRSMQHTSQDDEIDDPVSPLPVTSMAEQRTKRLLKRRATTKTNTDFLDDDFQAKRPRGRPPKTEPTKLSPAELKRLSPSDRKYYEMRLRNNEASRRSRLNRKGKEEALFEELNHLEAVHQELVQRDNYLDKQLKSWEKKFIKLARL